MSEKVIKTLQEQLPASEMRALLEPDPNLCLAIKTQGKGYVYANPNFMTLMGFSDLKQFMHKKDEDLCDDATLLKTYREYDEAVYCSDQSIYAEAPIKPKRLKIQKNMKGSIHPLHLEGSKTDAVFFMHKPSNEILTLSMDSLLKLESGYLQAYLTKKSYLIQTKSFSFNLARMEILCFAEMLKGKTASQIAETLGIKQLTVESYFANLRDKCAVGKKNELVQFFIDNKILESIVV